MEEQMRAEALGEEAITRRDNFPVRQNMTDYSEKNISVCCLNGV
jgi:hypothetical protein